MSKKENYIDNKKLEKELTIFSETFNKKLNALMKKEHLTKNVAKKRVKGFISEELGNMFLKIAHNLINKNNFNNYTFRDEMMGLGIEYLCRFAKNFDNTKSNCNGFSYCTQICFNGFIQCITKENKKAKLKDKLIKESMQETELEKWLKQKNI